MEAEMSDILLFIHIPPMWRFDHSKLNIAGFQMLVGQIKTVEDLQESVILINQELGE